MSDPVLSPDALAIVDWLGELGARWGLPDQACRVHGLLFLIARPLSAPEIGATLAISEPMVEDALVWLDEDRLVLQGEGGWSTHTDPWRLVTQALEARRAREMDMARLARNAWDQDRQGEDPMVARQAQRLFDLVEDIASIDAGAQRLSPETMRTLIGFGGRAARLVDRAFGSSRRRGA